MDSDKEMAEYIYSILLSQPTILMSWGFQHPTIIKSTEYKDGGLKFMVSGLIFKGWVHILYNVGADLFDIKLITGKGVERKFIEGVYFDELVSVIDENVERVENYDEAIKKNYSKRG